MKIDDETAKKIETEYYDWEKTQYAGNSKSERQEAGQFFTPPSLSIKMLEKFDNLNGNLLDPSVGAGGLLAAAIIAGQDPRRCYGIELDPKIASVCRKRLSKLGVPRINIKVGNALENSSYMFNESLEKKNLLFIALRKGENKELEVEIDVNAKNNFKTYEFSIDGRAGEYKEKLSKIYSILDKVKSFYAYSDKNVKAIVKTLNVLFSKFIGKTVEFNNLLTDAD